MRKFLVGSIALAALCSGPVLAAEMPLKAAPLLFDWTGWYIGGNGGYSWGRSTGKYTDNPPGSEFKYSTRHRGGEGSVEGGYNFQSGNKVFGVELRTDFGRECGRNSTPDPNLTDAILSTRSCVDPFLLGPHFGILTDANHMLWYVAGGLAVGEVESQSTFSGLSVGATRSASANKWEAGWFIGAGIERMIDNHWSWKVEYDYVRLGGSGTTAALSPAFNGAFVNNVNKAYDNVISVGINYHFTTH